MKTFLRSNRRIYFLPLFMAAIGLFFQLPNAIHFNVGAESQEFKTTTVYFVRHTEVASQPPADPVLSDVGKTRAQKLAQLLEKSRIQAVYSSQFQRTILTAEPLAKQFGLAVNPLTMTLSPSNPREVSEGSLKQIVDKIYENSSGNVLVVGHTNTVPQAIKMLGGDIIPEFDSQKYDDLLIVTIYEKGKARVAHLKY